MQTSSDWRESACMCSYPCQPHTADAGAARTLPGRFQKQLSRIQHQKSWKPIRKLFAETKKELAMFQADWDNHPQDELGTSSGWLVGEHTLYYTPVGIPFPRRGKYGWLG